MSDTPQRRLTKVQFLNSLPAADLLYLKGKSGQGTRAWRTEEQARKIEKQARDQGIYSIKTTTVDLLAGLRNAAMKINTP